MIHRTDHIVHAISWQTELANSISSLKELLIATGNSDSVVDSSLLDNPEFQIRVPRSYLERIKPGDIQDPLLRQVLPLQLEQERIPGYLTDPVGESQSNIKPGVIHKYHGRVLFILTSACAINCRYCFRRHFPYQENRNSMAQWDEALDYVRQDTSITEVIYSGGDPLVNSDKMLSRLTQQIADIPHIRRLRIHTRLPIVIPQRVTDEMLSWLSGTRLQVSMVLHANHANELDERVGNALAKLRQHQITLLNQSVLLRGINDSLASLTRLSEKLFSMGVIPYYLHLLDKVEGAAHFDITAAEGQQLVGGMTAQLPGYLVPKLVCEEPSKTSKTVMMPL